MLIPNVLQWGDLNRNVRFRYNRCLLMAKKTPRLRGFAIKEVYAINDSDNSVGGTLRNNIR
jgi:hypothetical protein